MVNQEELFKKAISGNESRIYGVCCYYFGRSDDARDAYQEILLKVWLNVTSFRGESQMSTWVLRIAVNVCLTFLSKAKKNSHLTPFSKVENYDIPSESENESEIEEAKIKFFEDFKSRLNQVDRTLVSLYLEGIEYREIAQITGLSEVNARTRIHRIKAEIKKEWEGKYGA
jgi:RNA polymerase sigma-70 factor (ECF subfamily)